MWFVVKSVNWWNGEKDEKGVTDAPPCLALSCLDGVRGWVDEWDGDLSSAGEAAGFWRPATVVLSLISSVSRLRPGSRLVPLAVKKERYVCNSW